ncbi:hypothetical protein Pelo_3098 [Pelomyxa schiedti]|nr:hypothetical protein Pelo_3098 [Pelomyxa schiedti]
MSSTVGTCRSCGCPFAAATTVDTNEATTVSSSTSTSSGDRERECGTPVLLAPCGHTVCSSCWSRSPCQFPTSVATSPATCGSSTSQQQQQQPLECPPGTTASHKVMVVAAPPPETGTTQAQQQQQQQHLQQQQEQHQQQQQLGKECPLCKALVRAQKENKVLMGLLQLLQDLGCPLPKENEGVLGGDVATHTDPVAVTMCAECLEKKAVVWCEKDEVALCEECNSALHSSRVTKLHVRVAIEKRPPSSATTLWREPKCKLHPGKDLDIWCTQDRRLCCYLCKDFGSHKGHSVLFRDDACLAVKQELLDASCVNKTLSGSAESQVQAWEKMVNDLRSNAEKTRTQIQTAFSTIYKRAAERESQLLSVLDDAEGKLLGALQHQIDDTVLSIQESQEITDATTRLTNSNNSFSILQSLPTLQKFLSEAASSTRKCSISEPLLEIGVNLSFIHDLDAAQKFVSEFGSIAIVRDTPLKLEALSLSNSSATLKWGFEETTSSSSSPPVKHKRLQDMCFKVELRTQPPSNSSSTVNNFKQVYCGKEMQFQLTALQPATAYLVRVAGSPTSTSVDQKHPMDQLQAYCETEFKTLSAPQSGRRDFREPGKFTFTVPEGVSAIHAIAIGGGGAGGSYASQAVGGSGGGDSAVDGVVLAGGGKGSGTSKGHGGDGGYGSTASGGCGGGSASNGYGWTHGGGGACGGSAGEDRYGSYTSGGGVGGSTRLKYAGRGGNGGFPAQESSTQGTSGEAATPQSVTVTNIRQGWLYGGGGGGSYSWGGGGGGYSVVKDHPVTPGQVLNITVGSGGEPLTGSISDYTGGTGGHGLVVISWGQDP